MERSLKDQVQGNTSNDLYCVGDGQFCNCADNKNRAQFCVEKDGKNYVNVENGIPDEYWTAAPNFIGDMGLRTCSEDSSYDFALTQDQVQQKCTEEHNKHKNDEDGWLYNTEHEFKLPPKNNS